MPIRETVMQSQSWDGAQHVYPSAAAPKTSYAYSSACWDSTGQGCDAPGAPSNKLMGFALTTIRHWDQNNGPVLTSSEHYFETGSYWRMGRETQSDLYQGDLTTRLQRTQNTYLDSSSGLPAGIHFVYLRESISSVWQGGQEKKRRQVYYYEPADQGGKQYGNRTRVYEYDASNNLYRIQMQRFIPLESAWIVDKPDWSATFNPSWKALAATHYFYDGEEEFERGPKNLGRLTLTRARIEPLLQGQEERTIDARFSYDAYGHPTAQTVYQDYGWARYNGSAWQKGTIGGGAARTSTTTYETSYYLYPTQVKNPRNHATTTQYYGVGGVAADYGLPGQVKKVTDPNGAATEYRYDAFGRLKSLALPGDSPTHPTEAFFYYDGGDKPRTDKWPLMIAHFKRATSGVDWFSGGLGHWQRVFYDGLGRPVQSQQPAANWHSNGGGQDIVQYTQYDALGRAVASSVPYAMAQYVHETQGDEVVTPYRNPDAGQPLTRSQYDALGRVTKVTQPDGSKTRTAYSGWRTLVLDANGHQTVTEVDALGRLAKVKEYSGTYNNPSWGAGVYATTRYTYNRLDQLVRVKDAANNQTLMTYDALGRKLTMDDPDMGDWSYQYNPAGNLTHQDDAKDQRTCFYYDALERLRGKYYTNDASNCPTSPSYAVSYTYDQGSNGIGRRMRMNDGSGYTTWTYDTRGRVTKETRVVNGTGGGTFATRWGYDAMDRVKWIKYPGGIGGQAGEKVSYSYGYQGLEGVSGSSVYVKSTAYDAAGRVDLRKLGNDVLRTHYDYYDWDEANGLGRLRRVTTGIPSDLDSLQDLRYNYDAVGNVKTIKDYRAGNPQTQNFNYDALDRLTSASVSGGSDGKYNESYVYGGDNGKIGNLTKKGNVNYGYNAGAHKHAVTHLNGTRKYWYDANGNQTKRVVGSSTFNLTYDKENRLTDVSRDGETTRFVYDGDGQRVKQTNRFGATVYVGNHYERFVPQEAVIGEVGYLNDNLTDTPKTVTLNRHYVNPVVFAQPISRDGTDTAVVRITDVQSDRFTLYVDEAPNKDGAHTSDEAVSYLVLEAGQWELSDGTLLEVGLVDTADTVGNRISNHWEWVNFNLPFTSSPVVISQVQTEQDARWVKTRQKSPTANGFKVALEREENATSRHGSERIGWLAIEAGKGTWNGHKYKAAKTSDAVTHNWYQISFSAGFSAAPRFFAALRTYHGGDSAHLRYKRTSLSASGVQVMIEEDTTYDTETNHTTERVSYLAVQGNGALKAKAYVSGSAIVTKYYYAGAQRVALRQAGELHYLLGDHLGSTAIPYRFAAGTRATADSSGGKHSELR